MNRFTAALAAASVICMLGIGSSHAADAALALSPDTAIAMIGTMISSGVIDGSDLSIEMTFRDLTGGVAAFPGALASGGELIPISCSQGVALFRRGE